MRHARFASWLLQKVASLSAEGNANSWDAKAVGYTGRAIKALRTIAIQLGFDPPCRVRMEGIRTVMLLPFSHQLPIYRSKYRNYDRLPEALATYVREFYGGFSMIDVGANVGDTIISTAPQQADHYLALEPHPDFFPYLLANTDTLSNVTCLQLACGEAAGQLGFDDSARGTAAFVRATKSVHEVRMDRLDAIWSCEWNGAAVNFLKIDTDGFDVSALMGALELLRKQQPWVLYECDVTLTAGGLDRHLKMLHVLGRVGYMELICYDNLGKCLGTYQLGDSSTLRGLLEQQSPQGPVWYHDMLLVPANQSAEAFLAYVDTMTTSLSPLRAVPAS